MKFRLYALRYTLEAGRDLRFPEGGAANLLRGSFGAALRRTDARTYDRLFAPHSDQGPSGFADRPRPFSFRAAGLEGRTVAQGGTFQFGFHLFDVREPWVEKLGGVFAEMLGSQVTRVEGADRPVEISLEPGGEARKATVRFVTPTELKSAGEVIDRPEFGVLVSRARDRVGALRALYGNGPLKMNHRAFGERAANVTMTRCELRHVEASRRSKGTGQVHSLGGFVGQAEYAGDLGEFLPFLRAAEWTGIGRQTAWGKGVIEVNDVH